MTSTRTGLKWAAALAVSALLAGCATAEPVVTPSPIVTEEPAPEPEPEPEPVVAEPVVVFEDGFNDTYPMGVYSASGDVTVEIVEDAERGSVLQNTFNSDESVTYFQRIGITNFSDYTTLEFDLKVVTDPRTDGVFFIKMECGYPCGSGDFPIELGAEGEWVSYSIAIADLIANEGSTLDLGIVNTPLTLVPGWGNQMGLVFQVDNVRVL